MLADGQDACMAGGLCPERRGPGAAARVAEHSMWWVVNSSPIGQD